MNDAGYRPAAGRDPVQSEVVARPRHLALVPALEPEDRLTEQVLAFTIAAFVGGWLVYEAVGAVVDAVTP